jgi:hypothetical protein
MPSRRLWILIGHSGPIYIRSICRDVTLGILKGINSRSLVIQRSQPQRCSPICLSYRTCPKTSSGSSPTLHPRYLHSFCIHYLLGLHRTLSSEQGIDQTARGLSCADRLDILYQAVRFHMGQFRKELLPAFQVPGSPGMYAVQQIGVLLTSKYTA